MSMEGLPQELCHLRGAARAAAEAARAQTEAARAAVDAARARLDAAVTATDAAPPGAWGIALAEELAAVSAYNACAKAYNECPPYWRGKKAEYRSLCHVVPGGPRSPVLAWGTDHIDGWLAQRGLPQIGRREPVEYVQALIELGV